jgi:hypothetical protein
MSYNGNGVFVINTAGQPVITGTTISSTTFNNLTADLATGLTTALTKDGQSTPTANIGMGAFKITNLAAGTVASDAARLDQVQGGSATFITAAGTDTITGTTSPALTAYATGNQFSFLVANTNTGAVTINVDGLGAKAITRTGTTALVAGDMVAGQAVEIIYDGTRFQLVNGNSFTNLKVSGTLGVTGVATFTAQPIASSLTASLPIFTDGSKGLVSNTMTGTGSVVMSASPTFTGTVGAADLTTTGNTILGDATTDTLNVGAGGLVKDASGNVGIGVTPSAWLSTDRAIELTAGALDSVSATDLRLYQNAYNGASGSVYKTSNFASLYRQAGAYHIWYSAPSGTAGNAITFTQAMTLDASGSLLVGTTNPASNATEKIGIVNAGQTNYGIAIQNSNALANDAIGFFNNSAARVGAINFTTTTTAYQTSSDYRLKNTIAPMTGALAKVALLKPCTYKWNVDNSDGQGFIAHELQEVVPDCVTGEKDAVDAEGKPVHQGIDTSFLVATLTAAIQELKAIVDAQAVRIAALEA